VASDEEKHTVVDKGKGRAAEYDQEYAQDEYEHDHHSHTHHHAHAHTVHRLTDASYPINIDEWARSPSLVERRESLRHPSPDLATPAGFGAHCSDPNLPATLARSNSFPKTAGPPRTTPRRAPPPPLKLVKSNSSLALPEKRSSGDSGVVIETHRPDHSGPAWDSREMATVALTPHGKEGSYSSTASRKSGLVGILKTKRESLRQPKKVRLASPKSSAWASSILSPQARQRSPGKTEYNIGMYQPPHVRRSWRSRIRTSVSSPPVPS
jgi:hypothetical protein